MAEICTTESSSMAIPPVLDTTVVYRIDKSLALAGYGNNSPLNRPDDTVACSQLHNLNDIDDRVHLRAYS